MGEQYEVMSPWADADPIPLRGIAPRLNTLDGKRIGLFTNDKVAAPLIQNAVERRLKERFPSAIFPRFFRTVNLEVNETPGKNDFEKWVREVDAVILTVAD